MRAFAVLLIVLASSHAQAATGCLFVAQGEAQIDVRGELMAAPLKLGDCEGVKIAQGTATVCFLNERDERTCRTLKAGESFSREKYGAHQGAGVGSFKATLVSLLKGDAQTRIGAMRKGERLAGFPYEKVLALDGDVVIWMTAPKARALKTLTLQAEGSDIQNVIVTAQGGMFRVPVSGLKRGETYTWEARSEDLTFDGVFHVASVEQAAQLSMATMALQNDNSLDETGRKLLQAELYFENGFAFDAAAIMDKLGRTKQTTASAEKAIK